MTRLKLANILTAKMEDIASVLSALVLHDRGTINEKQKLAREFLEAREKRCEIFSEERKKNV